jgi:hypothetical protein
MVTSSLLGEAGGHIDFAVFLVEYVDLAIAYVTVLKIGVVRRIGCVPAVAGFKGSPRSPISRVPPRLLLSGMLLSLTTHRCG